MDKNNKNYSGGVCFGFLQVDEVKGLPKSFSISDRHTEPWVWELKNITGKWDDCAVYYSYRNAVFNNVKVIDTDKGEHYLPHIYIWAEAGKGKVEIISSHEMEQLMPLAAESTSGYKRISFTDRGSECCQLTDFIGKYDKEDPAGAQDEKTKVIDEIRRRLQEKLTEKPSHEGGVDR